MYVELMDVSVGLWVHCKKLIQYSFFIFIFLYKLERKQGLALENVVFLRQPWSHAAKETVEEICVHSVDEPRIQPVEETHFQSEETIRQSYKETWTHAAEQTRDNTVEKQKEAEPMIVDGKDIIFLFPF